ncbi:serine peptidase, partial [Methylorubrum sp. Q1]
MTMTVRRRAFASVAAAALVAGGAAGFGLTEPTTQAYAQALPKTPIEAPEHPPGSFANVVDKVKPGVVAVKVKLDSNADDDDDSPGGPNMQQVPPQLREFFKRFGQGGPGAPGGRGMPQRGERGAVGS